MSIASRRLSKTLKSLHHGGSGSGFGAGSLPVGDAAYAIPPTNVLYIAPNGNDTSGTGTISKPFQTLSKALVAAVDGTTIVIRAGIYHEGGSNYSSPLGITVRRNNITIQNYPNEAVWFDGSTVKSGWTQSDTTWSIPWDIIFDHSPTDTSGSADGTETGWKWINDNYPCAPFPEQVFINGVPQTQVQSLVACGPGTFFVEGITASNYIFTPSTLYIGSDPTGKIVSVTDLHMFLNLDTGYTGLTVRGIGFRRYGNALPQYSALRFDGNNNTTNCLAENIVAEDIATLAIASNKCHDNTFRNITVRRAGYRAMGGHQSDNLTFDKILIEQTNTENFNSSPDSGCIKVTQSQHVTLSNSLLRDNKCKGMWFDMSVYDMQVYNNDFIGHKDTCVFFEIGGSGICANNLFVDCPAEAIKVNNTDNMRIWNNTIVNCANVSLILSPDTSNLNNGDRRPFAVYQESRRPANTAYGLDKRYPLSHEMYTTYMTWQIHSIELCNNIVADTPANAYNIFSIDDLQQQTGGTNQLLAAYGVTMDGNVFHWASAPTTSYPYPYIFPSLAIGDSNPVVYSTHAAMVGATGLDRNGTEYNPKGSGTALPSPLTASYVVDSAHASLHANATPLDSTIASLIGQPTNTKHAGCWRS